MVWLEEMENPVAWYRERYPDLSNRTRQRDFKKLSKIDYRIVYNPLHDPDPNRDSNYEPGWYSDFPTGANSTL